MFREPDEEMERNGQEIEGNDTIKHCSFEDDGEDEETQEETYDEIHIEEV